jgi:uncharacterized membrane protein YcaP (DUF421 family)
LERYLRLHRSLEPHMERAQMEMFFEGWPNVVRVLVVGTLAYLALLILLRVSGKRTLSKMNAFDLVVTVALGSALANVILSPDTALAEGIAALALLIGLQASITWLSVRSDRVSRLVKSDPSLLYYRGGFIHEAMRRERVNQHEVVQAMRQQGYASEEDVEAVVLETDGSFSILGSSNQGSESTLARLAEDKGGT